VPGRAGEFGQEFRVPAEAMPRIVDHALVHRPRDQRRGLALADQGDRAGQRFQHVGRVGGVRPPAGYRAVQVHRAAGGPSRTDGLPRLPSFERQVQSETCGRLLEQARIGNGQHREFRVFETELQQDFRTDPGRLAGCNGQDGALFLPGRRCGHRNALSRSLAAGPAI
jgi:hypothetical protein